MELWHINSQRIKIMKSLQPHGTLLDIGCGYGFFLKSASEAGYSVQGMDISSRAIDFANNSLNVSANITTIQELIKSGKKFQIITLWHVLEHYLDPYFALRTVRDMLMVNGTCILEVPNLHSLKFKLARNKWSGGNHPLYHRTFFTAATLQRAIKEAGFSRFTRLKLSYSLPGRNIFYYNTKRILDQFAYDSFLTYAAWK
jgi:2-polyprenyl-3-methyl-5-hydroxy-6-metoxy-1,4-benzoquinol methylase